MVIEFPDIKEVYEIYLRGRIPRKTILEFFRRLEYACHVKKNTSSLDVTGAAGKIVQSSLFNSLSPIHTKDIISWPQLVKKNQEGSREKERGLLKKLLIVKLNGGVASTMSLNQPKSDVLLKNEKTFLQLFLKQMLHYEKTYEFRLPCMFMNSKKETLFEFVPYETEKDMHIVFQELMPRVFSKNLLPFQTGSQADWYPPGHGDILELLSSEKIIKWCKRKGLEYAFVSNIDNLNAVASLDILDFLVAGEYDFAAEITKRTISDKKGGFFFQSAEKKVKLIEYSQIPEELKEHKNVLENKFFNINNLWIRLDSLWRKTQRRDLSLDILINQKKIQEQRIIQLETAAGSAIQFFPNTCLVEVPRSRFTPVKTFADLLIKRSDCYRLNEKTSVLDFQGLWNHEPTVDLDDNYQDLKNFEQAFPFLPSLKSCRSLQVQGKFIFDIPNLQLHGDITFVNLKNNAVKLSEISKKRSFTDETLRI